jgi:hypothetical protein
MGGDQTPRSGCGKLGSFQMIVLRVARDSADVESSRAEYGLAEGPEPKSACPTFNFVRRRCRRSEDWPPCGV